MKIKDKIKVGKYNIYYVSDSFLSIFGEEEVLEVATPTFQILSKNMYDKKIEDNLKPGLCTANDILAFIKNPPIETKDGRFNLFYTKSCVVGVCWDADCREWHVNTWERGDPWWHAGGRVFSPANATMSLK